MSARAFYSHTKAFNSGKDYAAEGFYSGERICPPSARGGGSATLRAYLFSFAAIASVWALLDSNATWREWPPAVAAMFSSIGHRATLPAEPSASATTSSVPNARVEPAVNAAAPEEPPSNVQPLAASEITDAPGAANPAAPDSTPLDTPAPPVTAPADPYQKRAEAVGLNPDLSRALLARLSATDYRNAGVAIATALAKTPDTGVFVWPLRGKPGLALFWVHFVAGAAPNCRRYVVTIIKDRWSTTAPPMEKCGVRPMREGAKQTSAD